jgi:hypothetical protein
MKLNTINVVEVTEDCLASVVSFTDDEQGGKEAEELFVSAMKTQDDNLSQDEIDVWLDGGFYEQGNYNLYIAHS